jgi:hypothetical protein
MKSNWRIYFKDEKQAKKLVPDIRRKIVQSARRRASVCMNDLVLIAEGLKVVSGSKETYKRQERKVFPMPLTGKCFMSLFQKIKFYPDEVREMFKEEGLETIAEVRGFKISPLKLKKKKG